MHCDEQRKNPFEIVQRLLWGKKYHILRGKKGHVSTNLDSKFLLVIRTRQDSKTNLLYCLTSSKIWLIPHLAQNLTKLKKQNPLQVGPGEPAPTQLPWFDFKEKLTPGL